MWTLKVDRHMTNMQTGVGVQIELITNSQKQMFEI